MKYPISNAAGDCRRFIKSLRPEYPTDVHKGVQRYWREIQNNSPEVARAWKRHAYDNNVESALFEVLFRTCRGDGRLDVLIKMAYRLGAEKHQMEIEKRAISQGREAGRRKMRAEYHELLHDTKKLPAKEREKARRHGIEDIFNTITMDDLLHHPKDEAPWEV